MAVHTAETCHHAQNKVVLNNNCCVLTQISVYALLCHTTGWHPLNKNIFYTTKQKPTKHTTICTVIQIEPKEHEKMWEKKEPCTHQPSYDLLRFVDPASLYNLINKANLVHNLFLVYLSTFTCFGRLCAHHQEKQLCFCDTWYLLFCVDDCLVCRICIPPYIPDSHPHRITSTKCRINTVVSPYDRH